MNFVNLMSHKVAVRRYFGSSSPSFYFVHYCNSTQ